MRLFEILNRLLRRTAPTVAAESNSSAEVRCTHSLDALPIWSRQVENARQQSESAVVQLSALFSGIVANIDLAVANSPQELEQQAASAVREGEDSRTELSRVISDLRDAQRHRDLLNEELQRILQFTTDLSSLSDQVRQIAFQTNILSLNAAIEAAHAGDAGKGFAVVAAEVRKLSKASRDTGDDIDARISAINSALRKTAERTRSVSSSDQEILRRSEANIQSVLERQRKRVEHFVAATSQSRSESAEIKTALEDALLQLQFQDRVSQILQQVSLALAQARSVDDLSAANMASEYTTDEQRMIHAGLQTQDAAPQAVTFF